MEINGLTTSQEGWIKSICDQFSLPSTNKIYNQSNIVDDAVLESVGDLIKVHHAFSKQALSKDRFEYALEAAIVAAKRHAELAPRGNAGHDITIGNERYSLKTEAAAASKIGAIHISKFMELGKGDWELEQLRDKMLTHMEKYDRILVFRYIPETRGKGKKKHIVAHYYELVEIPKDLLLFARTAQLIICENSKQNPKPGYGLIYAEKTDERLRQVDRTVDKGEFLAKTGAKDFKQSVSLYFDGGTERKLQIKHLSKSLCHMHASWRFPVSATIQETLASEIDELI